MSCGASSHMCNVLIFFDPASPRGRSQRSGEVGEEKRESEAAGGAEESDQTAGEGATPQGDIVLPTAPPIQVNTWISQSRQVRSVS